MQGVILCGGRGTRLGKITEHLPKCMVEINSRPYLEIVLRELKNRDIDNIILVIGYKKNVIKEFLERNRYFGMNIDYAEQKELLGTGHATLCVEDKIKDDSFLSFNGDVVFDFDIINKLVINKKPKMVVAKLDKKVNKGLVYYENNKLVRIVEHSEKEGNNINAAIYMFPKEIFNAIRNTKKSIRGEYEITDAVNYLVERGFDFEVVETDKWADIGTLDGLKRAERLLR